MKPTALLEFLHKKSEHQRTIKSSISNGQSLRLKHTKAATRAVLKNFAIFTGKYLCWSLFLLKYQKENPTLLKREFNQGSCIF